MKKKKTINTSASHTPVQSRAKPIGHPSICIHYCSLHTTVTYTLAAWPLKAHAWRNTTGVDRNTLFCGAPKTKQSKAIRHRLKTANYCRSMALANTNSSRANSHRHLLVKVPIWNDVIGIALAGSICIPTDNGFGIFGEKEK